MTGWGCPYRMPLGARGCDTCGSAARARPATHGPRPESGFRGAGNCALSPARPAPNNEPGAGPGAQHRSAEPPAPQANRARTATAPHTRRPPRPARRGCPARLIRPRSTTAMTSASCAVCRRCAIATTVRPSRTRASERSRWRAARGSSSEVASSRTSVCGSASTSRASAICWACAGVSDMPPEPTSVPRPVVEPRAPTRPRRPPRAPPTARRRRRRYARAADCRGASPRTRGAPG